MHTVEHVLAAVGAMEIDDLVIEMSGPEPPIADGSAKPFVDALRAVLTSSPCGLLQGGSPT